MFTSSSENTNCDLSPIPSAIISITSNNNKSNENGNHPNNNNNNNSKLAPQQQISVPSSQRNAYNHSEYSQVLRRGLDCRVAPFAGVVAIDVVGTDGLDEAEEDLLPPAEDLVYFTVPASLIQMPLMQQARRIPFLFLLCISIQCFVLNFTTTRYPDPHTQKQLPDIMFDILPRIRSLEAVTAQLLLAMNVTTGIVIFVLWRIATNRQAPAEAPHLRGLTPRRYLHVVAWLRWWCTFAIAAILRAVTIIMTTLPAPDNQCQERPHIDNIWLNTLKGIYSLGASNTHCGDLLFSGHTTVITLGLMTCWTYGPLICRWIRPFTLLVSLASFGTMLMSRSHYSDDIIVAVIVVFSVYTLIGHNPSQGVPMWVQGLLRPFHTLNCIVRGTKSALPEQSTSPLVSPRAEDSEKHDSSSERSVVLTILSIDDENEHGEIDAKHAVSSSSTFDGLDGNVSNSVSSSSSSFHFQHPRHESSFSENVYSDTSSRSMTPV